MNGIKKLSTCAQMAREHDYERYLAALFMPAEAREGAFALIAWNAEVAHIRRAVREEMIGHIRFAWWRERLDDLFAGKVPKGHPVLEALLPYAHNGRLNREHFEVMLDAYEGEFAESGFADAEHWITFCESIGGRILCLFMDMVVGKEKYVPDNIAPVGALYLLKKFSYSNSKTYKEGGLQKIKTYVQQVEQCDQWKNIPSAGRKMIKKNIILSKGYCLTSVCFPTKFILLIRLIINY